MTVIHDTSKQIKQRARKYVNSLLGCWYLAIVITSFKITLDFCYVKFLKIQRSTQLK